MIEWVSAIDSMEGGQSVGEDGAGGVQDIVRQLRARVAELEEENDLLAVAATHEPQLLADVKRQVAGKSSNRVAVEQQQQQFYRNGSAVKKILFLLCVLRTRTGSAVLKYVIALYDQRREHDTMHTK